MLVDYTDLEIGLYYYPGQKYLVELRFRDPAALTDEPAKRGFVDFDFDKLAEEESDSLAYGRRLTDSLFADAKLLEAFNTYRRDSQQKGKVLRLRLYIDAEVAELHNLRWEMLRDPQRDEWLVIGENVLFSRFLRSTDAPPVKLRSKSDLRVLVFVANPHNIEKYRGLTKVPVAEELARARAGLGSLIKEEIVSAADTPGRATLNNLISSLREGYDIVYIVCHGTLYKKNSRDPQSPEEPFLIFENDDGTIDRVRGADLVGQLRGLPQQPWLVVLASCQSAGHGQVVPASDGQPEARTADTRGALAALGPRLADAGVPAVLAMQGSVLVKTVSDFMPAFFEQLSEHGQIDRAVGAARAAVVRSQDDWWMPALFMRLREGRIWYERGFRSGGFEKWPLVLQRIHGQGALDRCTPILGAGVLDELIGSARELARTWAQTYRFPMAPANQEDLRSVAQYLTVHQDRLFPYGAFLTYLSDEITERYGSDFPPNPHEDSQEQLDQLIASVAAAIWQQNPNELHLVLAKLPFEVYITANPANLLALALKEVGKKPRVEVCPWNDRIEQPEEEIKQQPSVEEPLVFHLFGQLRNPHSLVLTEDDHLDYLIGVTKNKKIIPSAIGRAQTDSTLIFLGFQIDDWSFRVLLRSILQHSGSSRRDAYDHVAVQIVPEDGLLLETERARQYLEKYFGKENINIYWGSSQEFIEELQAERNKMYGDTLRI